MHPQRTQVPPSPSRSTTATDKSELGAANRAHITGRAAADENDVKGSHKLVECRRESEDVGDETQRNRW